MPDVDPTTVYGLTLNAILRDGTAWMPEHTALADSCC